MKKQTALEWYIQENNKYNKKPYRFITKANEQAISDKAKAMEKEQIINGWDNGFLDYQISMHEDAEQYYKETYED
jgi:hypothetical protein